MNYVHHALIGVGTAGLGLAVAEMLGLPPLPLLTLGMGALIVATGSIATDLDHPKSFISNSIPSHIIRIALAVLAIPLLAALAALLTTWDVTGTWTQLSGLVFGVNFLRWALIALAGSLGLMLLSWLLNKSLHHRGPLHSIIFACGVTALACWAFWYYWLPWSWGLAFGWGWLWHILADGLTPEGVPFFWPFNDERRHTLPVFGCGIGRVVLYLAVTAGIILLVYFQFIAVIN
jgi:membrane-bound metal-dependent hydrolase YbcI (DUF457 family)